MQRKVTIKYKHNHIQKYRKNSFNQTNILYLTLYFKNSIMYNIIHRTTCTQFEYHLL